MRWIAVLALLTFAQAAGAQTSESLLLLGFETEADARAVEVRSGTAVLASEHATQGLHSLRVRADDYLLFFHLPRDWSGWDALEVDIYCDTADPVGLYVLIGDEAWQAKSTYWNRYNADFSLRPGPNTISIPLGGLYRGEAGSRFNDLKTNIDPAHIVRLDLGFTPTGPAQGSIYLDNLRLTRWTRPARVWAFDFGPPSQSLAPGFTAVSPHETYDPSRGWGWEAGPPSRAWDVGFPTRLLQDSVDFGEATFRVDLPDGRYRVVAFFEDLGYWSGEQAQFSVREVSGDGWKVRDSHGQWGRVDHICRFEDTEPLPGADLWDVYLSYLFRPVAGEARVAGGALRLRVTADGPNARRMAALLIYPRGDEAAEKWAVQVLVDQKKEFLARAVELPAPGTPNPAPITPADRARGYLLFVPGVEETIYLSTLPTPEQLRRPLEATVARGERRSLTFALRPLRDLGRARVEVTDLLGERGAVAGSQVQAWVVRHLPTRGFNSLMYRITPRYLAQPAEADLAKDLTRQFWLTVRVPEDAAPGRYQGKVLVRLAQGVVEIPLALEVLPFSLEEADFLCGFWDIRPDLPVAEERFDAIQQEIFAMFRERGFTSFSGGPPIDFRGLDAEGRPILDFSAADKFMAQARKAGFRWEFNNYGGFVVRGLYDTWDYTKGETGAALEAQYGLPYPEILRRVWAAVEQHARENNWLPFTYTLCDETRTVEKAREQLELMQLMNQASPWLRTAGGYSVSFAPTEDPLELALQDFFRTLDVSIVNYHDELLMAMAQQLGKDVYIYNQGRGRYSFGLYQWGERAKGVKGRYEWISSIRHGYEYFDLDGREPDPSMVFFSSRGLRPSLALEQCAEGMNDFRYFQTLEHWAARAEASGRPEVQPLAREARAFLSRVADSVKLNQREQPAGIDLDALRAEAARRIAELVAALPSDSTAGMPAGRAEDNPES